MTPVQLKQQYDKLQAIRKALQELHDKTQRELQRRHAKMIRELYK